jgi:hypothetical protein
MSGIIGRLRGGGKLTLAQKHQLLMAGVELHDQGQSLEAVEAELKKRGAGRDDAKALAAESLTKFETELVRSVRLPASVRSGINFYFLLGVTPQAGVEQIRRAYRRKAKAVHPDQHNNEFTRETWSRLMTMVSDAESVLTDQRMRRAYDILWRQRSRKVALENRRKGQLRGDWETRYRWDIAEVAEREEQIETLLGQLREGLVGGSASEAIVTALHTAVDDYESRLLSIRTQTYSLATQFDWLAEDVRQETVRKERLVRELHQLTTWLPEAANPAGARALATRVDGVVKVLAQVRQGQNSFDLRAAR